MLEIQLGWKLRFKERTNMNMWRRKSRFNELVLGKHLEPLNETSLCVKEIINICDFFSHHYRTNYIMWMGTEFSLNHTCVCKHMILFSSGIKSCPTYSSKNKYTHEIEEQEGTPTESHSKINLILHIIFGRAKKSTLSLKAKQECEIYLGANSLSACVFVITNWYTIISNVTTSDHFSEL